MAHVMIVCTANICRSPVAEALLRDRLQKEGLADWEVSSAGTWAEADQRASVYGAQIMAELGLDIHDHRSRPIRTTELAEADLILCMESGHVEALRAEFPHLAPRVFLLTEMSGQSYSVHDPYGGPRIEYERMVKEVTGLIEDGLPRIIELAEKNARLHQARE